MRMVDPHTDIPKPLPQKKVVTPYPEHAHAQHQEEEEAKEPAVKQKEGDTNI